MSKFESSQKDKPESVGKLMEKNTQENLNAIDKETDKFNDAWIELQKECFKGYSRMIQSIFELNNQTLRQAGANVDMPSAVQQFYQNTFDGYSKMISTGNQIMVGAMDVAKKNMQTFNENATSFSDLNNKIIRAGFSAYSNLFGRQ